MQMSDDRYMNGHTQLHKKRRRWRNCSLLVHSSLILVHFLFFCPPQVNCVPFEESHLRCGKPSVFWSSGSHRDRNAISHKSIAIESIGVCGGNQHQMQDTNRFAQTNAHVPVYGRTSTLREVDY